MASSQLLKRNLTLGQLLVDQSELLVFEQDFLAEFSLDQVSSALKGTGLGP
jgi:hypothetical protein